MAPVNLGGNPSAAEVVTRRPFCSLGGNHADETPPNPFGKQPLGRSQELFARLGGGPFGGPFGRRRGWWSRPNHTAGLNGR